MAEAEQADLSGERLTVSDAAKLLDVNERYLRDVIRRPEFAARVEMGARPGKTGPGPRNVALINSELMESLRDYFRKNPEVVPATSGIGNPEETRNNMIRESAAPYYAVPNPSGFPATSVFDDPGVKAVLAAKDETISELRSALAAALERERIIRDQTEIEKADLRRLIDQAQLLHRVDQQQLVAAQGKMLPPAAESTEDSQAKKKPSGSGSQESDAVTLRWAVGEIDAKNVL